MKKINEYLIKRLSYEMRLAVYRLVEKKEIKENEFFGALQLVEEFTKINLVSNGFDAQSMSVVGIDTCCNYFKALCQQYCDLKSNDNYGEYIAHQKRFDVVIGSKIQSIKPRIIDIGLYDSAKVMDEIVSNNFAELINGSMKGNNSEQVYQYAMYNTFADMYYSIRDLIEGKSYYDGQFMTTYRELPFEYENESQRLINSFKERAIIQSPETAKNQLINTLNEGIKILAKVPIKKPDIPEYDKKDSKRK